MTARTPFSILALVLCGGAVACSGTNPGGGSGTLFAEVDAEGRPDSTRIRAIIRDRGNPVIGANVVITDDEREVSMNLEGLGADAVLSEFRYEGTLNRYARTLSLDVTSGDDRLDARLVGPAAHVITRPPNDAIVRRADFDFLTVRWDADGAADKTTVIVGDLTPIELEGDPFEVQVPIGGLPNGTHTIEVRRESTVELAGGVEGSVMRIRYKVDNRFTLES